MKPGLSAGLFVVQTFYLQQGVSDNREGRQEDRLFLDSRMHSKCAVVNTLKALSWIDARAQIPA